ncbi:MAG: tripartite tricarboxylate transporter substrate binding protein [Proteobacteria bacterium]|nr:tripartite tricarboxylate transporter substrate binding protein [Burkholderiales bacterium]MCA0311290.1 tripartite tricarboxylate transporter substrate binding protein [Pseudomonadota bacterium]
MKRRTHLGQLLATSLAMAASALPGAAWSAGYPERPITLVVPFTAGGPTDTIARIVAEDMARTLGQPVIIENKPGASTIIGAQQVARAKPDGYTLLVATPGTLVTNQFLYKDIPYNADRDLDLVQMLSVSPLIAVVSPKSAIKDFDDLITRAKANPNQLSFASVGVGGVYQLAFEWLQEIAGIKMTHVPYKGSSQALVDVMSGVVDMMFDTPTSALPHIQAGKLRPIAVTSPQRFALLPEVPTIDARYPAFDSAIVWAGLVAPKGLPPDVRGRIKSAVDAALASEKYLQAARSFGLEPLKPWSSDDLSKFITGQRVRWGDVIKRANIHI